MMLLVTAYLCSFAIASICLLSGFQVYQSLYIEKRRVRKNPSDYRMDYQQFRIRTVDNKEIESWLIPPPVPNNKGTIILCHNFKASKEKLLPYARFLYRAGFSTVLFDFRSHGNSGRDGFVYNYLNRFKRDLEAIAEFVSRQQPRHTSPKIGLMGFSIGCAAIALCSTKAIKTDAIVFDSGPPYDMNDTLRRMFQRTSKLPAIPFYYLFRFICMIVIGRQYQGRLQKGSQRLSDIPVLFIHGQRDHILPSENTRALYDLHNGLHKEYWLVPNAFHLTNHHVDKKGYEKKVVEFYSQYLQG